MSEPFRPLEIRERSIIMPGAEILGGVLPTRFSLVADVDENPEAYQEVMGLIDERLFADGLEDFNVHADIDPFAVKEAMVVIHEVLETSMPYDTSIFLEIIKSEAEKRNQHRLLPEDEFGLSAFIGKGGMCHQHALLSAVVLRTMQVRGDLGGEITIVRDPVVEDEETHMETHLNGVGNRTYRFSTDVPL